MKNNQESVKTLQEENSALKRGIEAYCTISKETPPKWRIIKQQSSSEVTPVIVASDWHIDEIVDPETVNDLNKFNPKIAEERVMRFFENTVKLYELSTVKDKVRNMILALLGDFISGSIHDELMESNSMPPIEAIMEAEKFIYNGIQFLLDNTKSTITIPCSVGNHSRTTKERRHATASGNNLETFMYHSLARRFQDNKRVRFLISKAYHNYIKVYDQNIRFHHGDNIKYNGGIGGIYIPANKAIAQWNKAKKDTTLDTFGHYHTAKDGGNFVANGSLIGYNAYAMSIKADYEPPRQQFYLIHPRHGKTLVAPIFLD